jgi:uncharacterized Rmd1/YagE family protein
MLNNTQMSFLRVIARGRFANTTLCVRTHTQNSLFSEHQKRLHCFRTTSHPASSKQEKKRSLSQHKRMTSYCTARYTSAPNLVSLTQSKDCISARVPTSFSASTSMFKIRKIHFKRSNRSRIS